jgi:cell division protein FtsW
VPGVGRTVNGATRWIPLGVLNLQPSELMKFFAVIYLAGYLTRCQLEISTTLTGFLRPMILIGVASALIMIQPDFGTTAVLLAVVMGLLFLGGVPILHFAVLFGLVAAALAVLVIIEPYRFQRVVSFLDPFADPFNTGYQLSQALIAFGRGELLGVGLGNGIQKQFFLPEAHTDFLLAVVGEELGLLGVLLVIGAFAFLTWRAFRIGAIAHARGQGFAAYVAHGFGLMLGLQAFVNAGVNTGLLPTKGLTLPFMSYGSNALIVSVMAVGVLARIDFELRRTAREPIPDGGVRLSGGRRWRRA